MFDQAVLVEVGAVAVGASEGVSIRYRAEANKQKSASVDSSYKSGMLIIVGKN